MAGTCTVTTPRLENLDRLRNPVTCYELNWTADGSGNVSVTPDRRFSGAVTRVVTDPDSSVGETYSLTITDVHGIDILGGLATACSASVTEEWLPFTTRTVSATVIPVTRDIDGQLTITISSVTASSSGKIYLYVR